MNKKEDTMRRLLSIALVVFVSISMIFASGSGEADNQKVIRICQFKVEIADDWNALLPTTALSEIVTLVKAVDVKA